MKKIIYTSVSLILILIATIFLWIYFEQKQLEVVSTSPSNESKKVELQESVVIKFSKNINKNSVEYRVVPETNFQIFEKDNLLIFSHPDKLSENTTYTFFLDPNPKLKEKDTLQETFKFNFTTIRTDLPPFLGDEMPVNEDFFYIKYLGRGTYQYDLHGTDKQKAKEEMYKWWESRGKDPKNIDLVPSDMYYYLCEPPCLKNCDLVPITEEGSISNEYTPMNLFEFENFGETHLLKKNVYNNLQRMLDDIKDNDIVDDVLVKKSFANVKENIKNPLQQEELKLGTAFELAIPTNCELDPEFCHTEYADTRYDDLVTFLENNAFKYGFIQTFPSEIPLHLRFISRYEADFFNKNLKQNSNYELNDFLKEKCSIVI